MIKYFISILFCVAFTFAKAQNPIVEVPNAQTPGTLTVTVTTTAYGGTYSPKNVVSVWIQDSSGKFVKSLLVYAVNHLSSLTNWVSNSASNKVDAITGASQTSHGVRVCQWNGTNTVTPRAIMADGTYTLKLEMSETNSTGKLGTFTFVKGPDIQTITPTNITGFSNISIKWIPSSTGVEDIEMSNLYSLWPNPTKSSVFVNGQDIQEIELLTIKGKRILTTSENKINCSKLANGIYLARIKTKHGVLIKKIIKE